MHFRYSAIAASMIAALSLTGCGSDSSDSKNNDTTNPVEPTAKQIKVIDGYLSQAQVCVDRNSNSACDANEVVGLTDSNGAITIKAEDAKYAVIAQAIAGKTSDSDKAGLLGNSYELIADTDSKVVTPFTTMAEIQDKTVTTLAAELNLDASIISGDYIAAKQTAENKDAAQKAHLMARSMTNELAPTVTDNDAEKLTKSAEKITEAINASINNDDNLDDIVIEIDENGTAGKTEMIASLSDYLEGNTLYFASLNNAYAAEEGIFKISFKDGILTVEGDKDPTPSQEEYRIEGNSLVHKEDGNESKEEFIYVSTQTSLAVTPQNDLNFWTTVNLNAPDYEMQSFNSAILEGQTWYYLDDDSTDKETDRMLAAMTFDADGMVLITEEEENMRLPWQVKQDGTLSIDFPEGDNDLEVKIVAKDSNIMTIASTNGYKAKFSLMLKDKTLADSILAKWGEQI